MTFTLVRTFAPEQARSKNDMPLLSNLLNAVYVRIPRSQQAELFQTYRVCRNGTSLSFDDIVARCGSKPVCGATRPTLRNPSNFNRFDLNSPAGQADNYHGR
jgi:hypothetical protein